MTVSLPNIFEISRGLIISTELQSQRDNMSKLREELRKARSEYDELQLRFDDEVYSGGAWN